MRTLHKTSRRREDDETKCRRSAVQHEPTRLYENARKTPVRPGVEATDEKSKKIERRTDDAGSGCGGFRVNDSQLSTTTTSTLAAHRSEAEAEAEAEAEPARRREEQRAENEYHLTYVRRDVAFLSSHRRYHNRPTAAYLRRSTFDVRRSQQCSAAVQHTRHSTLESSAEIRYCETSAVCSSTKRQNPLTSYTLSFATGVTNYSYSADRNK
ncbi:hypothetical protein V9T40_009852 [Parthenolecanium corni]|uniref:Uncharacterized protein n=1 Tax=Parthenolecanium corni TaxID=536013 RepID=A0AAN9TKC1_9HEMI